MSAFDLNKIRADFPMLSPERKMQGKPLVWLDNASTTLKPNCVREAVDLYYTEQTSNSHRGDYDLCHAMDVKVSETRALVAKLINCDSEEVIFTSGATDSLNLVAQSYALTHLKPGDEIVLDQSEHASNLLPWYHASKVTGATIKMIELDERGAVTLENAKKVIGEKTKIIAIAQVGNVLGYLAPIKEIAALAHSYGAIISVDGAQSVPHRKVDVKELDCDFLSFSGHKMCGPTGIGVFYGKKKLLKECDPYELGGGMNVTFDDKGTYTCLPAPSGFEPGTLNLEGILGLGAAISYLLEIGMDVIEKRDQELKEYAVKKLREAGVKAIYNEDSDAGIVAFNVNGVFAQDAATYFNSQGIAVRSGQHCAKALPEFLGTPATVRASFYFYTSESEIDALADAAKRCEGDFLNAYFN